MATIPLSVAKYIRSLWMSDMVMTYLHVDGNGHLKEWGGHPRYYGLYNLSVGQPASEQIAFLEGLLPVAHTEIFQFVEMNAGSVAHIHVLPANQGTWILLFDATTERDRQQQIQQQVNELSILNYRQTQLLNQIEEARQTLTEEKQGLENIIEFKSRFIATLSHELRAPLSSIIGYTEMLDKAKEEDEKAANYLTTVKKNANYLVDLVDNILDQAQLEIGQIELHKTNCDLKELNKDLKAFFLPTANAKNLTFDIILQGNLPIKISIDELRFRQVLINLINNALKFTERGFVKVTLNWQNEKLHFSVEDTGSGVSPEARKQIFTAFYTKDSASVQQKNKKGDGVGLGLTISQQLVQLMEGELKLEHSSEAGTIFSGFITAPSIYYSLSHDYDDSDRTDYKIGAKVLVVDDNSVVRMLTEVYLEEGGYAVLSACSGQEAIEIAMTEFPDLILIDLLMPEMDGYATVQQLRKQDFAQPIVALSASNFENDYKYALEVGCNDYLTKPVDMKKLLDMVDKTLKQPDN